MSGDNKENYVGVSPEYQNAAYKQSEPLLSGDKDQAAVEKEAHDREVATAESGAKIGIHGYESNVTHPSQGRGSSASDDSEESSEDDSEGDSGEPTEDDSEGDSGEPTEETSPGVTGETTSSFPFQNQQ